ncbi:MAG: glycosyltransferase [Sphaerospermopsis kisseleviana]
MKKALFVVSTWKPCMMADMQRVRLIAAEMPAHGWDVEILAPDASFQKDFSRVQGEGMAFPEVTLHEAHPWCPEFFERIGSRNIGIRASVPVRRLGAQLCRRNRYDLVYFSTTQHWLTCQGASWRGKSGVPYVVDLHDPIHLEKKVYFVSRHRLKEKIAFALGRQVERLSLGRADGLISVSQGYIDDAARRNPAAPWVRRQKSMVEMFPADLHALTSARHTPRQPAARPRVVYVGAGGNIMEKGWLELVDCLKGFDVEALPAIELHGTDTDWRRNKRLYLQEAADSSGLKGIVKEHPARISYQESVSLASSADGLLVLGVDDPNYRPSKLHTYLATGLPVLAILHADSPLAAQLPAESPCVHVLRFGRSGLESDNRHAVSAFLNALKPGGRRALPEERGILTPALSAAHHARFFECVVDAAGSD